MANLIYSNKTILLGGKISAILGRVQADQNKFSLPVSNSYIVGDRFCVISFKNRELIGFYLHYLCIFRIAYSAY